HAEREPLVSSPSSWGGTKTSRRSLVLTSGHLSSQVGGALVVSGILDRAPGGSNFRTAFCSEKQTFAGLRRRPALDPQAHAAAQLLGHPLLDRAENLPLLIPGAEVSQDDQLVAELLRPFSDVVQVRVTELVNLLLAVLGPEERHLGNQDLRIEDGGET